MKAGMAAVLTAAGFILCAGFGARAADAVEPSNTAMINLRGEAIKAVSPSAFFSGSTLRLTNCTLYAGETTNSARQGLDAVAIELRVGTLLSNTVYAATVSSASNGTWTCDVLVPTNQSSVYLQVKLTDAATNIFIYPWKTLNVSQPLE